MAQVGTEAMIPAKESLEGPDFGEGKAFLGPTARAHEVDVVSLSGPVVLDARFLMCVREDPHSFQRGERPVDGRGIHPRYLCRDALGQHRGADVPLGADHLEDYGAALRRDPEPLRPQALDGLVRLLLDGAETTMVALQALVANEMQQRRLCKLLRKPSGGPRRCAALLLQHFAIRL